MAAGVDPRTPVLVGAAAITQRSTDPAAADDAVALMAQALRLAADNAGGPNPQRLVQQAELIMSPQASWPSADPGRSVAELLGITPKTLCAMLGVLQQTLFTKACQAIAAGHASVVLVCGGEARARAAAAAKTGIAIAPEPEAAGPPDTLLEPAVPLISKLEIGRQLFVAARQYAMIETAVRAAAGHSLAAHAREVAALWDGFADVARTCPEAWKPDATPLGDGQATPGNPWYSWPYTRQHVSYWTVDQVAGHILCSVEAAEAAGIPRDRWVFPLAAAESNAMIMLSERAEPHRSPAIAATGRALTELTGVAPADADFIDLYSCFPVAVRVQANELGIRPDRPWTVTGGMSFGGGPLNNYVLQSTARMIEVLRDNPGSTGLVTSISGFITKQGMGLWSTTPPGSGFRYRDVSEETLADTTTATVDGDYAGPADVLGYTVTCERGAPHTGIAIAAVAGQPGVHTIATTDDPAIMTDMMTNEWVGRSITISQSRIDG